MTCGDLLTTDSESTTKGGPKSTKSGPKFTVLPTTIDTIDVVSFGLSMNRQGADVVATVTLC